MDNLEDIMKRGLGDLVLQLWSLQAKNEQLQAELLALKAELVASGQNKVE